MTAFVDRLLLPAGVTTGARPLMLAKAMRAFVDGYMAIVLPAYLLALGYGTLEVGLIATATLLGSALATIAVGTWGHRVGLRPLLQGAALLMAATGLAFAAAGTLGSLWPLLVVAFIGTLNPSSGDVSVFLPLEHARLAQTADGPARTALYARYSVTGVLGAAVGALAAGLPDLLAQRAGIAPLATLQAMFVAYAVVGALVFVLYRRAPTATDKAREPEERHQPLGASRRVVMQLAALFAVDAFAGGLVINALLALWLLQRFDVSLAAAGSFFFWTGLLGAASQLLAPKLAERIGLINTMVFTHIPANLCLVAAAFAPTLWLAIALLLVRASLSQMDVPARTAFVMAVVTPAERPAAASFTAVPRSLAAALGPTLGGALFAAGWIAAPLVLCGLLKTAYDLALWHAFRRSEAAMKP